MNILYCVCLTCAVASYKIFILRGPKQRLIRGPIEAGTAEDEDFDISRQNGLVSPSSGDLIILLLEIFLQPEERTTAKKRIKNSRD